MQVELTEEEKVRILCTEDLFEIMRRILFREGKIGRNREHFWIVGLNDEYFLQFIELAALGSGNQFVIKANEAFQLAVHKLSTYVVLVHNHPGTFLNPSEADLDATDRLIHAGEILNLEVIEHLIINENEYFSFRDKGLIDELFESKKYRAGYLEVDRIHQEGKEEGMEIGEEKGVKKGKKEKAIEMATVMKQKGLDIQTIKEISGLSIKAIKKL